MPEKLFVTCGKGLEGPLMDELRDLGFERLDKAFCGVYVDSPSMGSIGKINYCSRIASRVLLPLMIFQCYDKERLYKVASTIDWISLIPKGKTFAIDANVTHKRLRHSLHAAQVVKDAICDQFREATGERPSVQVRDPDVQINLFINGMKGVISFDTSGAPLYRRGYRQWGVEAPLQETLAAAILRRARYNGEETLCDPLCGGATFLTEAAMIATKTPAGFFRKSWGFFHHPNFSQQSWEKMKQYFDDQRCEQKGAIIGYDRSADAIEAAKKNIGSFDIELNCDPFQKIDKQFDLVVANPPYGKRISAVSGLYTQLGEWCQVHAKRAFVLAADDAPYGHLKMHKYCKISNGGIPCHLWSLNAA